ncbi:leucine zipper putative tumor suppressor 2a [Scleropages formosus]|uniref:Leucine zipper putative tumor suppressor 2 homolog n=1 Tax=Scleropages formosus TaxID=113540 RepID=A0A8C9SNK0_SCLFO|nr:leucine zipper putative tumor suppressor 2 [Scleropages formosus]XP_029106055.1 leucine zipper putative tumor suppressor 2 [Scleropages formosus]
MALVQALPVPTDPRSSGIDIQGHSASPPAVHGTMGSVSSLIAGRSYQERNCRPADFGARSRKPTPGASCFRSSSSTEHLVGHNPPPTSKKLGSVANGNANYAYLNEDFVGDWNDNHVAAGSPASDPEEAREARVLNGNIGGPPPKLIPVSGKLEKNMEKTVIRPTAFKPVVPKNRNSVQYLSPRPGGTLSESQGSLNLLLPSSGGSPSCGDKRGSYSGGRNGSGSGGAGGGSQSCGTSDSGRNSLSSLPTYSSTGYGLGTGEAPVGQPEPARAAPGHGHSASDSGRSSSSKSTGSLGGRGQPLSDGSSCGRSPAPAEGYECIVRELEDKLRERELELQQLRDNLDENEAAICQVYEEKQKRCELELEELRQSCASRMRQAAQRAQRAQQVLQLQVYQLQQEKKKLQEDFAQLLQERELLESRCASIQRQQTQLGPRLEETKWEVCQKSGEISLLKQQLKDLQAELSQRTGEIIALKAQLREARAELQAGEARAQEARAAARTRTLELEVCENELQRRKSEAELLREKAGRLEEESARLREALGQCRGSTPSPGRGLGLSPSHREAEELLACESDEAKVQRQSSSTGLQGLRQQVERLRAELMFERRHSEEQLGAFEEERRVWQEEKEKVIRYQKQLQQNYVQMYQRNRELERVMRELSLELETRELEEMDGTAHEIHFEEIAATEI